MPACQATGLDKVKKCLVAVLFCRKVPGRYCSTEAALAPPRSSGRGLGAQPPAGSRGAAPGGGLGGRSPSGKFLAN